MHRGLKSSSVRLFTTFSLAVPAKFVKLADMETNDSSYDYPGATGGATECEAVCDGHEGGQSMTAICGAGGHVILYNSGITP